MEEPRLGFVEFGDAAELLETAPTEIVSEEEEDFEFAFSIKSDPGSWPDTTADEIFYNGRILPAYPLFNRDLIGENADPTEEENLEESVDQFILEYENRDTPRSGSESSSSSIVSVAKGMDQRLRWAAPASSAPQSPDHCRKSSSTGSSASASASRRWKLRDLVVGRSRSDGKERFVVIPLPDGKEKEKEKKTLRNLNSFAKSVPAEAEKKEKSGKGKGQTTKEMDIVTAHRIYYGKVGSGGGQPPAAGSYRRSFLPYRQELLGGIFGNAKHHPF
ncbi:uncharacterized protein LOC110100418 [Dendrobium catenatum]|uniref:Uncharacterized protein n=1 Tax=Dendrobium catenatum TaxID=906689 RepID=A0A2I0X3X2_9ASPA|nr:uncharacterized protein LOC110100418 [Dendrobium catenatum]PKU82618.1 hypothetical protein MA16_Dca022786 [Dendrobium catenatum]